MYKVLIVDDESWVLENYRLGIDWASKGFEVVDTASNGMEALEKIRQLHPDLVLTDIRMPVMGGLEMIRQAKQMFPDLEFVVISGYAEFSYAQKALNFGVAATALSRWRTPIFKACWPMCGSVWIVDMTGVWTISLPSNI